MRQSFARFLQEGTKDGLTNGEHIIRTLIQKAKDGDMKAIEYVLDRMGGKPLQSVEVGTHFPLITSARRIASEPLKASRGLNRCKLTVLQGNWLAEPLR